MREFRVARTGNITHLSFSSDGRWLAVSSERVNVVNILTFSNDGMLAAVVGENGQVVIWDLADPETEFLGTPV